MLFLALLLQSAAPPPPPVDLPMGHHGGMVSMACPVGGEKFEAWRAGTYSTYGTRPDGKPYSYMPFPFPLPECPTNRLVVFDDFTPADVAKLQTLVATPDYRAMIAEHGSHYRAAWLATRLGRPEPDVLRLLLQAIWAATPSQESAGKPVLAGRYQTEFVTRIAALSSTTPATDRRWLLTRGANALRQLGRFDEAEAMRKAALAVPPPAGEDADETTGWTATLRAFAPVIAARDDRVEPIALLNEMLQPEACIDVKPLTAADRAICERPNVARETARLRKSRAETR